LKLLQSKKDEVLGQMEILKLKYEDIENKVNKNMELENNILTQKNALMELVKKSVMPGRVK
jgi:hypothetical protein